MKIIMAIFPTGMLRRQSNCDIAGTGLASGADVNGGSAVTVPADRYDVCVMVP
jgi:hypothetical protein